MRIFDRPARVFLLAVLSLGLAGCGQPDEGAEAGKKQWRFAIEEIEGSVQHAYATTFKREVEARSEGRIEVVVYPYGQLGTSSQLTELVQLGSLEFAMASPGHLGSVIPEVQVFSLHFLFSDDQAVNRDVLASSQDLHDTLNAAYNDAGLELLGLFQEGWMAWTANRELAAPADFKGLKIRTMNSPLLIQAYSLYGANPTTMPYSEVYSGLQLNMIDAQVNPVFAIQEMSFHEVQDHLVRGKHLPFIASVVSSPAFMQGLSAEESKMVEAALDVADEETFAMQRDLNKQRLKIIESEGGTVISDLSEEQRDAFRQASLPIRDTFRDAAGERGARILDIITTAIAEQEKPAGD